jgi:peptidoglycan/LPS O-acetylase OafA/YrhL
VVAVGLAARVRPPLDATLRRLHENPLGLLAFVVPVALGFWLNREGLYAIETPTHSAVPVSGPLATYGTWFVFGWLLRRQPNLLEYWRRRWAAHAAAGLAIGLALFELVFSRRPLDATPASLGALGVVYALGSGLACVLLVAGFTGFFERFASTYSPAVRYLADSSYWMYLAHLPIVLYLQVLAGPWHLHWTLKFTAITLVTIALCLVSYHHLVRLRWLGTLLNGPRTPASLAAQQPASVSAQAA